MKNFIFVIAFLLTIPNLVGQETKEIVDVIRSSDYEGSGTVDFYMGEAHYTLQYNISTRPDDDTETPCFFFYNPNFLGGLLISTDKSDVTKMEITWNDSDCEYTGDMWMYVSGSDTPWESVQAVMDAKPESDPQKFRYYAYDARNELYGNPPITVVIPEKSCKHYAITPGYIGVTQVKNYVFEFRITRRITVETGKGFSRVTEIDPANDIRHKFVLATSGGKILTVEDTALSHRNVDVTAENEIYESEPLSKFVINPVEEGRFQLMDAGSNLYLGRDDSDRLTLGDNRTDFTLSDGMLQDETGATLSHDGSGFIFSAPVSRASTVTTEPIYLYRSSAADIPTGVTAISDETANLQVEYYTIDGKRLSAAPSVPGLYLQRIGNKVTKKIFTR